MVKRSLYTRLKEHLEKPEITLIVGPRQAGKTTLMRQFQDELITKQQKTLFLSLDDDAQRPFFETQESLVQKIKVEFGTDKGYVFIDEVQRKTDAGLYLKGIYDRNLPYKFVVSGSGSVELKEKVHESLAGRKRLFELTTFSFSEVAHYQTSYRYEDRLAQFLAVDVNQGQILLDQYLGFGGYPKVVLAKTGAEKMETMREIYQSYLEKDIAILLNIQKTEILSDLVRILASQTGSLVNVSEISSTLGIAVKTVNDYLWYLEKTYIIERVTPFFRNLRKEITKSPVVYFLDLGMKNYAQRLFGATVGLNSGFLFQNFVFLLLKEGLKGQSSLHFWRTQDKAEVDFVIDTGSEIIPIEVKYTKLAKPEITRSFRSFLEKYKPQRAFVIHLGESFEAHIDVTRISFIPHHQHRLIFS